MKIFTKSFNLALALSFVAGAGFSQSYCIPPGFINIGGVGEPFTFISKVRLENLDNTTGIPTGVGDDNGYTYYADLPNPVLQPGETYLLQIVGSDNINSGQELRVWIDWDGNKEFAPVDELVGSWHASGLQSINFVVPEDAVNGVTRMRVYGDMPFTMGHLVPEPCGYLNYPTHSVGHHGEVEDYDVQIGNPTGIDGLAEVSGLTVYPSPAVDFLTVDLTINNRTTYSIVDMAGKELATGRLNYGRNQLDISSLQNGHYILAVKDEVGRVMQQFQVSR